MFEVMWIVVTSKSAIFQHSIARYVTLTFAYDTDPRLSNSLLICAGCFESNVVHKSSMRLKIPWSHACIRQLGLRKGSNPGSLKIGLGSGWIDHSRQSALLGAFPPWVHNFCSNDIMIAMGAWLTWSHFDHVMNSPSRACCSNVGTSLEDVGA